MPEAEPPGRKDDDGLVLRDAVKVLTEEVQLQKQLMSIQNARLQEYRQELDVRAEELHRGRQEARLNHDLLERQAEDLRQAAREAAARHAEELRQAHEWVRQGLEKIERQAEELRQAHEWVRQGLEKIERQAEELRKAQEGLRVADEELRQARQKLNTRFWRYTEPARRLLGLFDTER
jgi:chromosome segregation ATPase